MHGSTLYIVSSSKFVMQTQVLQIKFIVLKLLQVLISLFFRYSLEALLHNSMLEFKRLTQRPRLFMLLLSFIYFCTECMLKRYVHVNYFFYLVMTPSSGYQKIYDKLLRLFLYVSEEDQTCILG